MITLIGQIVEVVVAAEWILVDSMARLANSISGVLLAETPLFLRRLSNQGDTLNE